METIIVGDTYIPLGLLAAPHPTIINFSCLEIGVDSSVVLSELLLLSANGPHSLELRGNPLVGVHLNDAEEGDEDEDADTNATDLSGVERLLSSIAACGSLTYLGLSNTFLGADGLCACATALPSIPLTSLDVSSNEVAETRDAASFAFASWSSTDTTGLSALGIHRMIHPLIHALIHTIHTIQVWPLHVPPPSPR
jgi:hypothetical protein